MVYVIRISFTQTLELARFPEISAQRDEPGRLVAGNRGELGATAGQTVNDSLGRTDVVLGIGRWFRSMGVVYGS